MDQGVQVAVLQAITQGLPVKMVAVRLVKVMQVLADTTHTFLVAVAVQVPRVTQAALMEHLQVAQVFKTVS